MGNTIDDLIKASRAWARGADIDYGQVAGWWDQAIRINHERYFREIPAYRKLALEAGCGQATDLANIKNNLMFYADIFKSYDQVWLDEGDFDRMTGWLSGIFRRRINAEMSGVATIDDWIERLGQDGVHVVFSSGTSGAFSFVPREFPDWDLSRTANIAYLAPLLTNRIGGLFSSKLVQMAIGSMPPQAVARLATDRGLAHFDAAFLGFRRGRMGNQVLIEELAPLFPNHYFLYDMEITGTPLRCLRRGCRTEQDRRLVEQLKNETVERKEERYLETAENIQTSTGLGQKVFMFGAPYQFLELTQVMAAHSRQLELNKGSLALFGGGWKSFSGDKISRSSLIEALTCMLGLSPDMVLEGYSMTETNTLMLRCLYGCFHIPPLIEPVVFDEELVPMEGADLTGAFGFLDPLAVSYPGFIITGDRVRLTYEQCDCGLTGPSIIEIGRLPASEVKGCGGIMGSMQA